MQLYLYENIEKFIKQIEIKSFITFNKSDKKMLENAESLENYTNM